MLFFHHQIPEGSPSKPPEVQAPSPTLPWHPCKGNQHQPRLTPIAWDGFLEQDHEPDTNTVTARDLWPSNANFLILPTHRLRLVSRSHNCHVPPSRIFRVLWNLSLVGHRRVSPAVPGTRPGRPLFHSAFPRASQAPGSQSLAAAKECSDCFRVGVCGEVGRFHPLDECSRCGHRLSVLGCSFADCLQVFCRTNGPVPSSHL